MGANLFIELTVIIAIAVLVIAIMRVFKQPLIIGYIITGIIVSASFLDLVKSEELITTLSEIGIVLLLFMVGLGLNPKIIKEVGKVSIVTGIGQVLFTTTVGFLISTALGLDTITALYIAIAIAFSSTIIILKLLSDKGDTDKLYGKIAVGFLIVQDIIAIIALMIIASLENGGANSLGSFAGIIFFKGALLILLLFTFSHFFLKRITRHIAKSQEFLLLFSLGWGFAIASLFSVAGFSVEIGALLAGVTLSLSPYRFEISSKLKPIRDFFIFLFFVWLGTQIEFGSVASQIHLIIIFSLLILVGNPLIITSLMGSQGFKKRTSFLMGLTGAQISEFSLILVAAGVKAGHVGQDILSLVTVVGLITIAGSTYFIMYAEKIYPHISKYLSIFEKKNIKAEKIARKKKYDTILFGSHRTGYNIVQSLKEDKKSLLIVDFDPQRIERLTRKGYHCIYGDVSDVDLLEEINIEDAKMIISTVPEININRLLMDRVRSRNPEAIILVIANQVDEAFELYKEGATYVITPHFTGGKHIAEMISKHGFNIKKFAKERDAHKKHLDTIIEDEFIDKNK